MSGEAKGKKGYVTGMHGGIDHVIIHFENEILEDLATVPPYLMRSGIGSPNPASGDYDIMTADVEEIKRLGLDKLRFGDLVLLQDCDNIYGRGYLKGAVSIGVVIHSDCVKSGHGPGITTIMASKKPVIEAIINENANIKNYMEK